MSASSFTDGQSYNFTASDGVSIMTYTAGSGDGIVTQKNSNSYLKQNGTTSKNSSKRCFELKVTGRGKIKIETISNAGKWNIYDGSSKGTAFVTDYV